VNSTVGPFTSVGRNCLVIDATIEQSIALEGSSVRRVRGITNSVIGRSARVGSATPGLPGLRLIIGDDCQVMVAPCGSEAISTNS
jgi:glucose-1-phosphate thymidylyltransferase